MYVDTFYVIFIVPAAAMNFLPPPLLHDKCSNFPSEHARLDENSKYTRTHARPKREREREKQTKSEVRIGVKLLYLPGYKSEKVMNFAVACFYFTFLACGKTRKLDCSGSFSNARSVHADLAVMEGLCLRSFLTASE